MVIARVGLDIAKNVFQVNGVASDDSIVVRRQLRRHQVLAFFGCCRCIVGIEACPGAHHWGRQLAALGHEVRLMPQTKP
jgi:transposase